MAPTFMGPTLNLSVVHAVVSGGSLPTHQEGQLPRRQSYKIKAPLPSTDGFSGKVKVTRLKIFITFKDIYVFMTSNQDTRPLLTKATDLFRETTPFSLKTKFPKYIIYQVPSGVFTHFLLPHLLPQIKFSTCMTVFSLNSFISATL